MEPWRTALATSDATNIWIRGYDIASLMQRATFTDTIVLLHHGRVATSGSPSEVMRADRLESIYGWPVVITRDPAIGAPALVPLRRPMQL